MPARTFVIAGDGPLRDLVERAARALPNLKALGWVAREKIVSVLDDVDLLVLPSHAEAMGTVALEAMARQRNILVSSHCGLVDWRDLISADYVIAADETVGDAIERLARLAPPLRANMAERAARFARAMDEQAIDAWCSILTDAAARARAAG